MDLGVIMAEVNPKLDWICKCVLGRYNTATRSGNMTPSLQHACDSPDKLSVASATVWLQGCMERHSNLV
jgi:hypothetical protein